MESQATATHIVYSRDGLARLAFSERAKELSDAAARLVPTRAKDEVRAGWLVNEANRLAHLAEAVLELAILVERNRGSSWGRIGETLGVSRQAAHERLSSAVERWDRSLRPSSLPASHAAHRDDGLHDILIDPVGQAQELDQWVVKRLDQVGHDEQQVSGNLPLATVAEQESTLLEQLTAVSEALRAPATPGLPQETQRTLRQSRAYLLERLAALRPNAPAYAEAAAYARRELRGGRADRDIGRGTGSLAGRNSQPTRRKRGG